MQFVEAKSAEEQLLLTMIDRMHALEDRIDGLVRAILPTPPDGNPLCDFKPPRELTAVQEGRYIKDRPVAVDNKNRMYKALIFHDENVKLLKSNGFEVRSEGDGLHEVSWTTNGQSVVS